MGVKHGEQLFGRRLPNGKKHYTAADKQKIFEYASRFVDDVNFTGNKANRPGFIKGLEGSWMHGPVLSAFALQSFSVNQISQMAMFWKKFCMTYLGDMAR